MIKKDSYTLAEIQALPVADIVKDSIGDVGHITKTVKEKLLLNSSNTVFLFCKTADADFTLFQAAVSS